MKDGIYFLMPEGCGWIAAIFKNGKLKDLMPQSDADLHNAARDSWAGIAPKDTDMEVEDCEDIISQVLGDNVSAIVTCPVSYTLHMRDDGMCTNEVEFDEQPDEDEIQNEIEEWVNEGSWGEEGASLDVCWTLYKNDDEIDDGWYTVDVEPDEEALIKAAGGDVDCDHEWTAEGEGGCDQNPGVWATGGTSMKFSKHCRICGLHRTDYFTGSQKNPGEHDTVKFEQPENWCSECETEECKHVVYQ